MSLQDRIPPGWLTVLAEEVSKPYFKELEKFLAQERQAYTVYPREEDVFAAFFHTPFEFVKAVLLGQDPYPGEGKAHGLCFSVPAGTSLPASLRNIFKELHADIGCPIPGEGSLIPWARQGVLLLNTVMTVRQGESASHRYQGWEDFTDAVIGQINDKAHPVVFLLWGNDARKKKALIDAQRHVIIENVHPSPLSVRRGFFGSRPFSQTNEALQYLGLAPIDWCLPTA